MIAVETHNLCKSFTTVRKQPGAMGAVKTLFKPDKQEIQAVKDINLRIEMGERVGFLGPNGAGKTTTLKMLSGILYPTSGDATVLGFLPSKRDPEMLRRISLVMGNKQQLWWDLPAWESFNVLREIYEVEDSKFKSRVERLIEELGVSDKVNTQVRKLSLGERMKCELIAALLHSPSVLFLDEPTLGLDVVSQKRIRDFLKAFHAKENCAILLTSHYMQDVQDLCERVVVIDHGAVVFEGTLDQLSRKFSDTRRVRMVFSNPVERDRLERAGRIVEFDGESVALDVPRDSVASITGELLAQLPVCDVSIEETDVEDTIRALFTSGVDVSRETTVN